RDPKCPDVFKRQLEEAKTEWRRRRPKAEGFICARRELEKVGFPGFTFRPLAAEVLFPPSIFILYPREALLRDARSLREGSRLLCERKRSVIRPAFAESGSKNRLSQASQR